jgi:UDP-glucose 4-epimerase
MNILIIGAHGFIGSNINNYFKSKHNTITNVDVIEYINIHEEYYNINKYSLEYIFKLKQFDICIFCAGNANVQMSFVDIQFDYFSNTKFVHDVLTNIKNNQKYCKFLHISSAAVYGNPSEIPIKESSILKPISPYGYHKLQSEMICNEFNTLFSIPTCNIRPFSVYGPKQKKLLFWDLYEKSKKSKKIQLYGTGFETRDFIFIDDFIFAIDCIVNNASFNNDIINVANGIEISIHECIKSFIPIFDNNIEYEFNGQNLEGNPIRWKADITKLNSLGYQHKVELEEGLKKYKQWLEEEQF